jgi:ferrous iron transport protein A
MTIDSTTTSRLSEAKRGARGAVARLAIDPNDTSHGVTAEELERRLLEIGFVEGARFEVLHVGLIGGDPIAVRLNETRVALRRREAKAIEVTLDAP